jgi:hypothetical protein
MENPQKIEFKSLDDLCYLPQEELEIVLFFATLSWNVCRTAKRNWLIMFLLLSSFLNLLHMASHNSLGNNSKGVAIGFAKVIHFG